VDSMDFKTWVSMFLAIILIIVAIIPFYICVLFIYFAAIPLSLFNYLDMDEFNFWESVETVIDCIPRKRL
jgi:ABC-type glycerol-3-phosphate transport system permease component